MKTGSWLLAVFTTLALLIALGTGLRMRTLGIWAFQFHKIAGISAVILGIIITILWVSLTLKIRTLEQERKRIGNLRN